MPSKRPAPLASLEATNDGVPLPVKNTFIDVPSGLTPTMQTQSRAQMLNTAPAELNFTPGFIKRAVLASSTMVAAVGSKSPVDNGQTVPCVASSPRQRSSVGAPVQRPPKDAVPGLLQPPNSPPIETPSPTGKALFSSCRYQLFGGPAPVQEATHSTFAAPAAAQLSQVANALSQGDVRRSTAESLPESLVKERDGEDDEDDSEEDEEMKQAQKQAAASGVTRAEDAPKPPPGAKHPSLGSDGHEEGTCKRCCFYPRNRCLNGYNCEFCHYDHEKRKRKSKKKKKKDKEGMVDSGVEATVPCTGLLLGPPAELVGSAFHSVADSMLYGLPSIPPSHLTSQAVPPMTTHVWIDGSPPSHSSTCPPYAPPYVDPYQVAAAGFQVPATVSSPSYLAAATGSSVAASDVDNVQYLGTQPAAPPTHYMGYQSPLDFLTCPSLYDPMGLYPPPYEFPPELPPTLATTPHLQGLWAPPIQAPPSLSPPTLATTPAPPSEAPRLPQGVSIAKEDIAPPSEAPRTLPLPLQAIAPPSFSPSFPPSWEPSEPPPMCSPKLPKDIEFSLEQAAEETSLKAAVFGLDSGTL